MKKCFIPTLLFTALALMFSCQSSTDKEKEKASPAPVAEKIPHELAAHGNKRVDDYYWMKLSEEQKNAEKKDDQTRKVLTYLTAENEYLETNMRHTEALQEKLYNEMVGRIKQDDESVQWVAKLRDMKTDNNLLLLRTDMETGHGGASGRFRIYRDVAQEYAFLLDLAGKSS